jgi:serine protease AprX
MIKAIVTVSVLILLALQPSTSYAASSVDRLLEAQVNAAPAALTPVMITFDHDPTGADYSALKALGISGGYIIDGLPVVQTAINRRQFDALRTRPGVLSLYANHRLQLMGDKYRTFIGQRAMMTDSDVTRRNIGLPVSGRDIGIAFVDTGIDATHDDLKLGKNVAGNVFFPLGELGIGASELPPEFIPLLFVENQPFTDAEGGHGTFGAGIAAGIGQVSGGFYGGVAPGATLLGLVAGNDAGLSSFAVVQAYGYVASHYSVFRIRVCTSPFGLPLSQYPYDPFDPVNVATRQLHDLGITVVTPAGNDGDAPNAINSFSVAPWVISVAAGEKELYGAPASFSSRGNNNGTGADIAGQPANPAAAPNFRPDITGSGVNLKSVRAKGLSLANTVNLLPLLGNDERTISPGFLSFYTTGQGTSFAAAQVAGVVALMLDANPQLSPDEVVTILRQTATPMPYEQRVVGAGYVDAHNAVRAAFQMTAVPHPATLVPPAGTPEIVDAANDHGNNTSAAQDILSADFAYNAQSRQLQYTLTVADLSQRTADNQWRISANFGGTTIFVSAAQLETGQMRYQMGKVTFDAAGVPVQETIPSGVDAGAISGNQIIIWVSVDKISAALGRDISGTTARSSLALSQLLVGANGAGALVNADAATGMDFTIQ